MTSKRIEKSVYYAVRSEILERVNRDPILVEAKVLGKIYAVNAKKISSPHARVTDGAGVALTTGSFEYNVSDLLNDVKKNFDNTFSLDVYRKLKMPRAKDDFSVNLLYKNPSTHGVSTRHLLANALDVYAKTAKEKKVLQDYRNNISMVNEVQERLRKIRELSGTKANEARIDALKKTAGELAKLIDSILIKCEINK